MTEDTETNDRARMGDNKPPIVDPDAVAQARAKAAEFGAKAREWTDLGVIANAEQAAILSDLIAGARQVAKVIDDLRVEAKKPHDDAAKAVQAAFKPILDGVEAMVASLKPMSMAWLTKERDRIAQEAALAKAKADAERVAAEQEAAAAEARGDFVGAAEAGAAGDKAAKDAAKAQRQSESPKAGMKSASGAGRTISLTRYPTAKIDNIRLATAYFAHSADLQDLLCRLALAECRTAGAAAVQSGDFTIPGFTLGIEERL